MKTSITSSSLLLFCILLLSSVKVSSQIVNIPDPNFKTYLVKNSSINTNLDGEIQYSEAAAYSGGIDISGVNTISDLTGIEAFTTLTELYCQNNLLTSLDVSSNTALQSLYCYNNQLTYLSVSANPSLVALHCSDNQITSLDVSANSLLAYMNFAGNLLTSLNVKNGNNSNLSYFYAINNPNLTCIQVDDAALMNTNWPFGKDAGASYDESCPCGLIVSGNITYASNSADSVNVVLYKINSTGAYVEYDNIETDIFGNYQFTSLPGGQYVVKAIPSPIKYPNYLPTYFLFSTGTTKWNEAFVNDMICGGNPMPNNISLIEKLPQVGMWRCNGYIFEGYNYTGARLSSSTQIHEIFAPGEPIPDIDITIDQSPGGTVSSTSTDANGFFEFTGLNNNATFVLRVDLPGFPNDSVYTFTVTPGDPALDSLNFYVDSNSVFIIPEGLVGVNLISIKDFNINVVPNPTTENFILEVNSTKNSTLNITLTNSLGEVVLTSNSIINIGINKIDFDFKNQSSGVYFMSINDGSEYYFKKIIKQ